MGIAMIVEILDHSPPDLTPVDRLLLIVLAEKANDGTRTGYPGWELIAQRMGWAGHKDGGKNAVRVALARLAERGVDVRVPIGEGRDGRKVYATHGHRTTYRIPRFQRGADSAPLEGGQTVPPLANEGGQSRYVKGGNPDTRRGAASAPPSLIEPSKNPHLRLASLNGSPPPASSTRESEIHRILSKHGCTGERADAVIAHHDKPASWWRAVEASGDTPKQIAVHDDIERAKRQAAEQSERAHARAAANRAAIDACHLCDDRGYIGRSYVPCDHTPRSTPQEVQARRARIAADIEAGRAAALAAKGATA